MGLKKAKSKRSSEAVEEKIKETIKLNHDSQDFEATIALANNSNPVSARTDDEDQVIDSDVERKIHTVSLEEIITFCFPPNVQHPMSRGRLIALAEGGPVHCTHNFLTCLCRKCKTNCENLRNHDELAGAVFRGHYLFSAADLGDMPWLCRQCKAHACRVPHLRSGFKGSHAVTQRELDDMARETNREDILEAYARRNKLSRAEQTNFLSKVLKQASTKEQSHLHAEYTKEDISDMFKQVPKNKHGRMDFYAVREVVFAKRADRVVQLRKMYPEVVVKKPPPQSYTSSTLTRALQSSKNPDHQSFLFTSRLLSQHAHKLTGTGAKDRNNPALTVNVHLMRKQKYDSETNWKPFF